MIGKKTIERKAMNYIGPEAMRMWSYVAVLDNISPKVTVSICYRVWALKRVSG